jgi:hypothetical protein
MAIRNSISPGTYSREVNRTPRNIATQRVAGKRVRESTEVSTQNTNSYWDNVVLLLNFGDGISDFSSYNHVITTNGDAAVVAEANPFGGTGVLSLDGTDDSLSITSTENLNIEYTPTTWETWVNPTSLPSFGNFTSILSKYRSDTNQRSWNIVLFNIDGTQTIGMLFSFDGSFAMIYTEPYTLSTETWSHVAISWDGTNVRIFVNGQMIGDPAIYNGPVYTTSASVFIGGQDNGSTGSSLFTGKISNVRITKGVALYTENFSIPTAPFPTQGP